MKNTYYKEKQGERQARLIEMESFVFNGAKNGGIASWVKNEQRCYKESRKVLRNEDRKKNILEKKLSLNNDNNFSKCLFSMGLNLSSTPKPLAIDLSSVPSDCN